MGEADSSVTVENISESVVPDNMTTIQEAISTLQGECNLILTSGGTGFTPDDVTPEATRPLLDKEAASVIHAIQAHVSKSEPFACLSRATAGVIGSCFVLNLPGSPQAVQENL